MKKIFLILSSVVCVHAFATVRTVSNNPNTLAQFNTIQAAIDASLSGDTIYVQGSPTRYAGFVIQDKRLTVIGPGWRLHKISSRIKPRLKVTWISKELLVEKQNSMV